MKAVVAAFNQEKALVGAFSVITNLRMELFEALDLISQTGDSGSRQARPRNRRLGTHSTMVYHWMGITRPRHNPVSQPRLA